MTLREFTQGWMLLTAQPWGRSYRSAMSAHGEPSPGDIQSEFYFQTFAEQDGTAWLKACTQHATGSKWPSIELLKLSLKHLTPPAVQITEADPVYPSMAEALQERPDLREKIEHYFRTNGIKL